MEADKTLQRQCAANRLQQMGGYYPQGSVERLALTMGAEALREAVAKVKYGRWEPCFEDWRRQVEGDRCSVCGFEHYGTSIKNYNYCPNCGAPMTDEAVQMVMERMEALKDGKSD